MKRIPRFHSRRRFLKLSSAGAAAGLLAACSTPPTAAPPTSGPATSAPATSVSTGTGDLIVASWGGSTQELHKTHFFTPFAQQSGINVIDVSPFSYGKLKSMVEAGQPEWDVTIMTDVGQAKRAAAEGLVEPIDYSIVRGDDLDPRARGTHWCAGEFETVMIGYRKDTYGDNSPKGWADFWDVDKFPGKRSLHNWCVTVMEAALLADGVAPDKLYPLDIDRAFKSLDRIKPHIDVWWDVSAQSQSQQLLKDHEVDLINGWSGRLGVVAQEDPDNVGIEYEQALFTIAPWVVVKGAKNLTNAMKFMDFISQPEPQASLHTHLLYGPTNLKAFDLIDPAIAALLPSHPDNLGKTFEVDTDYWAENEGPVTERFAAWLLE